jgi:hypothetical protein
MTEAERQGPPQQYDEQGRPVRYVYVERARQEWSGGAIASFVFSVLWLGGLGSLIGMVIGFGSLKECRGPNGKRGEGLATWGAILGVLGLAALVVMIVSN